MGNDLDQVRGLYRKLLHARWYHRLLYFGALPSLDDRVRKVLKGQLAILDSMTPRERAQPSLCNASRINRISAGSGIHQDVVRSLLRFRSRR